MKKLLSSIIMGSVLFTGTAFAQDYEPVQARDGSGTTQYGVPARLMENQDIQDCVQEYKVAREAFSQELQQLRERLAVASDADKAVIMEQIRGQLKTHLGEEREFRKSVRQIGRELRKERVATKTGNGG